MTKRWAKETDVAVDRLIGHMANDPMFYSLSTQHLVDALVILTYHLCWQGARFGVHRGEDDSEQLRREENVEAVVYNMNVLLEQYGDGQPVIGPTDQPPTPTTH